MKYSLIYITAKDEAEAKKIGKALVEERLAACANIHPIKSIYRWKGKVQEEGETVVLLKTKAELADKVIQRVKELHSYETPCVVSIPIENGYKKFLEWVGESTR